jgi:hypothetical protein
VVNWLATPVKLSGEPGQLCWECSVNKLAICIRAYSKVRAPGNWLQRFVPHRSADTWWGPSFSRGQVSYGQEWTSTQTLSQLLHVGVVVAQQHARIAMPGDLGQFVKLKARRQATRRLVA